MQQSFSRRSALRHLIAAAALTLAPALAQAGERPSLDVPYIKTPDAVVQRMLELGSVGAADYLIDLGSGDGRIPIAAARQLGTPGLGVDLDPDRTAEAKAAAQAAGVAERLEFRTENLFDTDLSRATVITMYLFPEINLRLRPHLLRLKPGTRIVSHAFHMDEWTPERHEVVEGRDIFLWTVPARLQGLWRVTPAGHPGFTLRVWQQFNRVQATAITMDEHSIPAISMTVSGSDVSFTLHTTKGVKTFTGVVEDDRIAGSGGTWSAQRM